MLQIDPRDREKLIAPLFRTGWRFRVLVAVLLAVIGWGVVMYVLQLQLGLGQTGMKRPVYWGVYMVNFIFFIGISHAGTLISAILRVTGAEWRRPITRVAEAITVFALIVGTLQIILDMGRPDRLAFVILHGRLQSPILWDVVSVTTYFLGSVVYLYLPLIPDAAILRDNLPEDVPAWRRILYRTLALGWRGNVEQWRRLERAIAVMAVFIIPVAVSVHTIISWILATTVQPGWHSTIFGPYFVVGAIFSGIAALFLAMTAVRRILGLEEYIKIRQYRSLGLLFITMNVIWAYFTYAENLTLAAGQQTMEFPVLASKLWGSFAPSFWVMVLLMGIAFWLMVAPNIIPSAFKRVMVLRPRYALGSAGVTLALAFLLTDSQFGSQGAVLDAPDDIRTIGWILVTLALLGGLLGITLWFKSRLVTAIVVSAFAVLAGMWLERWNLVVPTLTHPRLVPYTTYTPTLTEVALSAASVALFILLFVLFFKLFPAVSIWEVAEGRVIEASREHVTIPAPESSGPRRKTRRWGLR